MVAGAALCLLVTVLPFAVQAQKLALSKAEVMQMLKSGEAPQQIGALARDYGISFEVTEETASELREAGANEDLIKALRDLASKPPTSPAPSPPASEPAKPPVLIIESTPGGAQVYVDDEPVGKTSAEGRLKLTQLSPSEHRVRVSHDGSRDHEQKLQLAAGETVRLVVKLEPSPVTAPVSPVLGTSASPGGTARPGTSVAFLGLRVGLTEANSLGGVPITEVEKDSPAERAGLRPGFRILAVDGQSVSSPQEVVQAVRAHRPGENAEIVFDNGSALSKVSVQLGGRALEEIEPLTPATPAGGAASGFPRYAVVHNDGSPGRWCSGVMAVGDGKIVYRSTNGEHSVSLLLSEVREIRKESKYFRSPKGFHIRMADGSNYNFVAVRDGKLTEPDELLEVIEKARGTGEEQAPREEQKPKLRKK